jgi:hypothetical protein
MKKILFYVLLFFVPFELVKGQVQENKGFFNPGFEENKGQIYDQNFNLRPDILFKSTSGNLQCFISGKGLHLQLQKIDSLEVTKSDYPQKHNIPIPIIITTHRIDIEWPNASKAVKIKKIGKHYSMNHYYKAHQNLIPTTNVSKYDSLLFSDVWPGVGALFYHRDGQLESDWLVENPEDFKLISFKVKGAKVKVGKSGHLLFKTPLGEIAEGPLAVYQNGRLLPASWQIKKDLISILVKDFEPGLPLRIDPPFKLWGTYLGGSVGDYVISSGADETGNILLTGFTESSSNMATSGAHQITHQGGFFDAFVTKFDPLGNRIWSTYYGSPTADFGHGIAGDVLGNVYVVGETRDTNSTSFATPGAHQPQFGGGLSDGFLAKFNSLGIREWASYYGGSGLDAINDCAIDGDGNLVITGLAQSGSQIATPGTHQTVYGGSGDFFVAKFNSNGSRLWGTYYGNEQTDIPFSIAVDQDARIYVGGYTAGGAYLASIGSHQGIYGGGATDGLLACFSTTGQLDWATFYGGGQIDYIRAVAVNQNNRLLIAGETRGSTSGIATPAVHQIQYRGGFSDGFAALFDQSGARIWGTYYGGQGKEYINACDIDHLGNCYIFGDAHATYDNISSQITHQRLYGGGTSDGFFAKLDSTGNRVWGSYLGGIELESLSSGFAAVDGTLFLSGYSWSNNNISTPNAFQTQNAGMADGFLINFMECDREITLHPRNSVASVGAQIAFTARSSNPLSTFQWQSNISGSFVNIGDSGQYSGTQTDSLVISNLTLNNNGQRFRCILKTGVCEEISIAASLILNCDAFTFIGIQPTDQILQIDSTATFNAVSTDPSSTYTWQINPGFGGFRNLNNSGQFQGARSPTLNVLQVTQQNNGHQFRCIVETDICTDTSDVAQILIGTISVNEINQSASIQIYPNPTHGQIHISGATAGCQWVLTDSQGRLVAEGVTEQDSFKIDLNSLSEGLYVLSLQESNDALKMHFKIIKQ